MGRLTGGSCVDERPSRSFNNDVDDSDIRELLDGSDWTSDAGDMFGRSFIVKRPTSTTAADTEKESVIGRLRTDSR